MSDGLLKKRIKEMTPGVYIQSEYDYQLVFIQLIEDVKKEIYTSIEQGATLDSCATDIIKKTVEKWFGESEINLGPETVEEAEEEERIFLERMKNK